MISARIPCLTQIKRRGGKQPDKQKDHKVDPIQKNTVHRRLIDLLGILFSQSSGQKGVDAYPRPNAERDHQRLQRKGQGYRRQGIFINARHKNTVYNII